MHRKLLGAKATIMCVLICGRRAMHCGSHGRHAAEIGCELRAANEHGGCSEDSKHGHCIYVGPIWPSVSPPSITMICPVISLAAGERRKTTAPAQSSGSPRRPSRIFFS